MLPELAGSVLLENSIMFAAGFLLDIIFGDPHFLWHPVQGIGWMVSALEQWFRRLWHISEEKEADRGKKKLAGVLLVILVLLISLGITCGLLLLAGRLHPAVRLLLGSIMCYQMLAMHSLKKESMKVYDALEKEGLAAGRKAVSMIVGRDTEKLTEEGVIRAAVETIAENTSDGVIAPMFYMCLLGPAGIVAYKAVNTMDSMVGYKNDRYLYLGRAAARLDDAVNYLPARLSAVLMLFAARLLSLWNPYFSSEHARRIYRRDRRKHSSPNSAQTEAVCAGALSVQLAGDAWYFGKLTPKPFIGDPLREIEPEDIKRANLLMQLTGIWMFLLGEMLLLGGAVLTGLPR